MLDALKKWLGRSPPVRGDWRALADWAEQRGADLRTHVEGSDIVIDGRTGPVLWRLEWGPSQRPYIVGEELRLRAELRLPGDLQVLLLGRPVAERLEKAVFEEYVDGVQTRIDATTPPEMRWLVMFPKVPGAELKSLRDRYVAVANDKAWLLRWLDSSLADELLAAPGQPDDPVVWMVGRGRLTLRLAMPEATPPAVEPWLALFETALRQARLAQPGPEAGLAPGGHSSLWPEAGPPGDALSR